MKHNWEYKKFGSLCNIVRGGSPRPIQSYLTDSDDGLNWIKIGDVAVGSKFITSTKERIKKEGLSKTRQVFKGDFILSNSMSFGRPYILGIDGCIHDGWLAIKNVEDHFISEFLYYYLSSPTTYSLFEKLVKGGVVSNLNSDIVKGIYVPVPPIEEQERIVAELDKINEVIADCRELLHNFDALAQSLFYDTFGDPISNPKGWEIKKLSALSSIVGRIGFRGYTRSDLVGKGQGAITLSPSNICNRGLSYDNCSYISWPKYEESPEIKIFDGEVIFTKTGSTVGKVGFVSNLPEKATLNPQLVVFKNLSINGRYLTYVLSDSSYQELIREKAGGSAVPTMSQKILGTIQIPVPPLALQEKFAARIEEIEAQKKQVEATIAEMQSLLDSRMDYWFND